MTSRNTLILTALLAVGALGLGACSDSSTPEDTDTDTTAPLVTGTSPNTGAIQVSTVAPIDVTFNEDMAPASATGQVTLSTGGMPTITWQNARTFRITHSAVWTEGTQVTVTVGTGLTDAAGNALAAPYAFSFFTETSALALVAHEPASGATNVSRGAGIRLQFSLTPDQGSIASQVTITDPLGKAPHPFIVGDGGGNGWVVLDPMDILPASTQITVTVGAGVHVQGSPLNTLGQNVVFQFTTGVDLDTTAPFIVSVSPASGATNVPADVGAFVVTFSEPVDPVSFEPASINLELFAVIYDVEPIWSAGNTVLTVGLPTLPAGLEMAITFAGYADPSGNVQNTPTHWSAKVAGTADIYPMADSLRHYVYEEWSEGLAGDPTPNWSGTNSQYRQIEVQPNDDVHLVQYTDDTFQTADGWEVYDRLPSAINWLGFTEIRDGGAVETVGFDTPLKFLPLPMAVGTWSGTTTVDVPGVGPCDAELTGHVIGREDLAIPLKSVAMPVYYKGAWKVARTIEVTSGTEWFTTLRDTTWYAPTLGPVREISHEDHPARDGDPAGWYRTEGWRNPLPEGFGK